MTWDRAMLNTMFKYKAARAATGYIEVHGFSLGFNACCYILSWRCGKCAALYDLDVNASQSIRNEAQRITAAGTVATAANRGTVSQDIGRKSSVIARAVEVENHEL